MIQITSSKKTEPFMRYLITTLTLLLLITPLQVLAVEVVCEGDYEILSMEQMQHLQSCNKMVLSHKCAD